ncbi:MAG: MFS transporter [Hyphomicrobiaceae bacterium]
MPILLVIALAGFSSALAVRILDPLVPVIARELATDPETVALLATAFALPYAIGQPVLGPLGDALGKARVIQGCLVVLALALAACALAPNMELLFAARVVSGLAAGGIIPLSFAIVGDRFAMAERQVALSRVLAAILFGGLVGGIVSGVIGSTLGWRAVLLLISGVCVATLAATFTSIKPRAGAQRSALTFSGAKAGYAQVFANPRAAVCYTAVFVEGVFLYGMLPFLALILEERQAGSVREAGFIIAGFGLGGVLFSVMVARLLGWCGGQMNMIRAGGIVIAAGLVIAALGHSWPAKAFAFVVIGIGFYMVHNSLQVQATELAPEARGAAVALHAFFFFLGHAAGPVVFGATRDAIGTQFAILISAAIMALLGFVTALLLERRGRPPRAEAS